MIENDRISALERLVVRLLDLMKPAAAAPAPPPAEPPRAASAVLMPAPRAARTELEQVQRDFDWLERNGAVTRITFDRRL